METVHCLIQLQQVVAGLISSRHENSSSILSWTSSLLTRPGGASRLSFSPSMELRCVDVGPLMGSVQGPCRWDVAHSGTTGRPDQTGEANVSHDTSR